MPRTSTVECDIDTPATGNCVGLERRVEATAIVEANVNVTLGLSQDGQGGEGPEGEETGRDDSDTSGDESDSEGSDSDYESSDEESG